MRDVILDPSLLTDLLKQDHLELDLALLDIPHGLALLAHLFLRLLHPLDILLVFLRLKLAFLEGLLVDLEELEGDLARGHDVNLEKLRVLHHMRRVLLAFAELEQLDSFLLQSVFLRQEGLVTVLVDDLADFNDVLSFKQAFAILKEWARILKLLLHIFKVKVDCQFDLLRLLALSARHSGLCAEARPNRLLSLGWRRRGSNVGLRLGFRLVVIRLLSSGPVLPFLCRLLELLLLV